MAQALAFWQYKSLQELTREEWEQLCDGCGKCCLHKLEDEETGEVYYTDVACRLFDATSCQCTQYRQRLKQVPGCVDLRPQQADAMAWLPSTCAYRLRAEGKPLPGWHHLVTGDLNSVHQAEQSVRGRVVAENTVAEEDMEDHVIDWVDVVHWVE